MSNLRRRVLLFGFVAIFVLSCTSALLAEEAHGTESSRSDSEEAAAEIVELEVDAAVELAFLASKQVRIAELAVEKAQAAVREARASRGPSVQVQGSSSILTNPPEGIRIAKGALGYAPTNQSATPVAVPDQDIVLADDGERTYFSVRAVLTQPLFTWGKLSIAENLARAEGEAKSHEFDTRLVDTDRQVRSLYLGGRLAQESTPIFKAIVEIAEQLVDDRIRSFDEGLIIKQSVLEARSQLAGLEFQLAQSREGLRTARESIAIITGISDAEVWFASPFRAALPEIDEEALVTATVDGSPDLGLLRTRLRQAKLAVDLAEATRLFLPDLSLSVTLDVTGQRIPIVGANWTNDWSANLIVSLGTQTNLFDSGKSAASLDQANADYGSAQLGVEAFAEGVVLQVRRSVELVQTAYFEARYAESKLALSREQEKNARVSYENELITREEHLGAKLALHLAELESLVKSYAFDSSLAALESLTGVRLQAHE